MTNVRFHADAEVRAHVPEGFRVICGGKRGDPLAVDEVCRRLDHASEGAREAAALSLSQVWHLNIPPRS
jgi:hypothetical protein